MTLKSIEVRDAEADGASMAIDCWTTYHQTEDDKKGGVAEEVARDFDKSCYDRSKKVERAAFSRGFFRQLLELTQVPK